MQEFIHHKVKTIEGLFGKFNKVQKLFTERSYDFDADFKAFLDEILAYFQSTGSTSQESDILKINNQLLTVKKGFDPIRMEKITQGRRELYSGFSFAALEQINGLLQQIYQKESAKLEEGEELISNLILSLYQNQILTDSKIKKLNSVAKIEVFWEQLIKQNHSISSIDKKLRMNLISEDIYLLFEKAISKIQ